MLLRRTLIGRHCCSSIQSHLKESRFHRLKPFVSFLDSPGLIVLIACLLIVIIGNILLILGFIKIMELPVVILIGRIQCIRAVGNLAVLVLKALPLLLLGKDRIASLISEKSKWQNQLSQFQQARQEAQEGEAVSTDDYYRIPAVMQDCKSAFNLSWNDGGSWDGNTFERIASIPNISGTVRFKATVSIARKPKYFLGVKIHRAIVQIAWELTTEYSDSQVVAVVNLDPGMSDQEKAELVNQKLSEVAREFPSCEPSVEYARSEPLAEDDSGDTYHLLWSSDRLEIARDIDSRLTKIYADLVSLEKMMHYRHSIVDIIKSALPYMNDEQGRRHTLVEECRRRWLRNAASQMHSDGYNGKYDDDYED